jgi:hypothetical protein
MVRTDGGNVRRANRFLLLAVLFGTACDPADGVELQPLPPLDRPSPAARAGLPEVEGVWRFAGWELAADDTLNLTADLPRLGEIQVQTQRLDSLAGQYVGQESLPLLGEARRDSVISLASAPGAAGSGFLAGRVQRDTLWVSLTSLVDAESWPQNARAAFTRQQVAATPFVRRYGQPVLAAVDTAAMPPLAGLQPGDTLAGADPAAPPAAAMPPAAMPPAAAPPARAPLAAPPPAQAPAQAPAQRAEPARPAPPPAQAAPPAQRAEPPRPAPPAQEPAPQAEPPRPAPPPQMAPAPAPTPPPPSRLLGEPVVRDTGRVPGAP